MSVLQGEKITCPLCTEEMDLTDRQLKPCKCGYDICVWCWNHIMDMAEKDETEGRCPACRAPYDKEKILEAAAKCERLVAEINAQLKKMKLSNQKAAAAAAAKSVNKLGLGFNKSKSSGIISSSSSSDHEGRPWKPQP